jgi:hypothetical protein
MPVIRPPRKPISAIVCMATIRNDSDQGRDSARPTVRAFMLPRDADSHANGESADSASTDRFPGKLTALLTAGGLCNAN